jgi:hypothetical protein
MCFSPVLSDDAEQGRERPVLPSRRLRMVAWPGSGQLRMRLTWARPTTAPSPERKADGEAWRSALVVMHNFF